MPDWQSRPLAAWQMHSIQDNPGTESPPAILAVESLCKKYSNTLAVDGISFQVGYHEILGLLGPNGAGKTTTINMILGVLEPTAGSVMIDGNDIASHRRQ